MGQADQVPFLSTRVTRGQVLFQRIGKSLVQFQDFCDPLLNVVRRGGPQCVQKIYLKMLEGRADPSDGYVLSINEPDAQS